MSALGEEFRSAREARGLSLSDVAERLHIRSVYLSAIEDEDWKAIGAPVYIRGFLRTYARFLGLDPEEAVARFSAGGSAVAPGGGSARPVAPAEERVRTSAPGGAGRRSPSVVAILAVLVAVAVVAYVGYAYLQYRGEPAAPVAAASPEVTEAPVADASAAPEALPTPVRVAAAPKPKRGLHVHLTQTSWLRITIDGTVVAEGTYPAGTSKSFTGKSADVRVGNAGGVQIAVDGRSVGTLGASGDVAERQFVLSGE